MHKASPASTVGLHNLKVKEWTISANESLKTFNIDDARRSKITSSLSSNQKVKPDDKNSIGLIYMLNDKVEKAMALQKTKS